MKKTYITIATLFILLIAVVLTRISDVKEDVIIYQTEIIDTQISTTTNTIDVIATTTPVKKPIVAENPEGEANPNIMKLNMKTWSWVQTTYNDGKIIKSKNTDKFKLTFNEKNKTFSATTDCNGVGGEYVLNGKSVKFDKMISTLMYCENSQEQEFTKMLKETVAYRFTNKGELIFDLKYDSGFMIFK